MKPRAATLSCLVTCLLSGTLVAHGGQYRGPGLPTPGGRGATPVTPGAIPQPAGSGPSTADRLGPDPTRWQIWWELNKDRYMRRLAGGRGDGAAGRRVTDAQRRDVILPALKRALERGRNRDVVTAVMIAFGKIGMDHPEFAVLPLIEKRLRRGDQEIRETAALAMGMTGQRAALEPLIGLLRSTPVGRRLVGKAKVDDRTRAFAAYGLGLLANAGDADVKRAVFAAARAVLEDRREKSREVLVAAVNTVRQLGIDATSGGKGKRLLWTALDVLHAMQSKKVSRTLQTVHAHVPTTVARLLGRGTGPDHERFKKHYAALLRAKGSNTDVFRQSAVLALGELVEPEHRHAADAERSALLLREFENGRDKMSQYYALIALGKIGGPVNRAKLIAVHSKAKGPTKSWAAIALGLLAHEAPEDAQDEARAEVGGALFKGLLDTSNRDVQAAHAVALGLAKYRTSAPELRSLLERYSKSYDLTGYLCVGLAMLDDRTAIDQIESVLSISRRRPQVMTQAALALARLENRRAVDTLHGMLKTRSAYATVTLASTANALGQLGDARSVEPLVSMMNASSQTKLVRAFAAVALGMVADDDRLPWNARIAEGINYRALVETLSNGSSGILDIL